MRRSAVLAALAAVWACGASPTLSFAADAKSAADLFPATSIVYVEALHPAAAIELIANHPLVKRVGAIEPVQKALAKDGKVKEFLAKLKEIETALGRPWRQAVGDLAENGIYVAIEPASQGLAVLCKGRDSETLLTLRDELVRLAEKEAAIRGGKSDLEESTYRGVSVYQHKETYHALFGDWFLLSNKEGLGRQIVDTFLDGDATTLADEPLFKEAHATAPADACAWGYVRLDVLRLVGAGKKVFADRLDDPAGELIAGGLVAALQKANYVTAALHLESGEVKLTVAAPFNAAKVPEERSFYFGAKEQAPQPIDVPNRLLNLVVYRDAAKWWQTAEEAFPENDAAKLAQADSQLTLF
ncbi:MAG TPA: DUF3352 domain-containing protein, partial [Pirellulales bacterium]